VRLAKVRLASCFMLATSSDSAASIAAALGAAMPLPSPPFPPRPLAVRSAASARPRHDSRLQGRADGAVAR
jgi:hypothetical protein